ncbi:MAG: branched-chain-amino-acid transaminase [Proteobacteria bacterium]|nr:branched-chain-amino-acid transaminase [Pseudomonadota bacterium]
MSLKVYVNGAYVDSEDAKVSVWDHGFLYGDGVFEGIRAYGGRVFRLEQHLERLYESALSIRLTIPVTLAEMREVVLETCRRNHIVDGYIRVVISRGKGDLGLDPRKCASPSVVVIADKIKLYPEEKYTRGLRVIISSVRRTSPEALDSKIKSLNYLNNILAKIEANTTDADEAVMLNSNGFVTECTAENIFVYKNGVLRTPGRYVGILEGVTRGAVIDLARRNNILVEETMINPHDLYVADEVFLTGTGAELVPVVSISGRNVGTGAPGPVFQRLLKEFRHLTQQEGTLIHSDVALTSVSASDLASE